MTRPPADEIERNLVDAATEALDELERRNQTSNGLYELKSALAAYSPEKEYTMPSWDEFMMDRIRYRNEFGVFIMAGEHRYYESTHNIIREALAREVK